MKQACGKECTTACQLLQVQALTTNAERYSLSAAVFTALTDKELEIGGLMSYDRAVIKMGAQALHQIYTQLIQASHALNQGPAGEQQAAAADISHLLDQLCLLPLAPLLPLPPLLPLLPLACATTISLLYGDASERWSNCRSSFEQSATCMLL